MRTFTLDDLREAAQHGGTVPCAVCAEPVTLREAVTSTDLDDVFCSTFCRDKREAEYQAYIERELARARRAFREQTPTQARRVIEWNTFADTINARA